MAGLSLWSSSLDLILLLNMKLKGNVYLFGSKLQKLKLNFINFNILVVKNLKFIIYRSFSEKNAVILSLEKVVFSQFLEK